MTLADLKRHRLAGRRPDGWVFLTLVPELRAVLQVAIIVGQSDEFIALAGLSVFLCFHTSQIEQAIGIADRLLAEQPQDLVLWGLDNGRMVNIVERHSRAITTAVPTPSLAMIAKELACTS